MKGYLTSYLNLLQDRAAAGPSIRAIEIPLIQRDYAQGRKGSAIEEIRTGFLEVLLDAVAGGEPVGLDFVYGRVARGILHPLDGQQRLSTLFLLHWYVASAAGRLDPEAPWTRFSYETRPSARLFCQRLAANPLPRGETSASAWITDQEWYLHVWKNDPTIQAMLVMIDSIHARIQDTYPDLDPDAAWDRLTDPDSPAIAFYLLPLDDMTSDEDLYIKMNSRGKPLTPFENFKARFEQDIAHTNRADEFAHKVDGRWSDLLWPIHGGDFIVDDEFMRYIDFITELCELRDEVFTQGRLGPRARAVFGPDNARATGHLDFLFDCFDVWNDIQQARDVFNANFQVSVPGDPDYDWRKATLFGFSDTNLFEQCCHSFDSQREHNRPFTLQQSLLLYAVLVHLRSGSEDFTRRVRVLRNLIAASEDEVRRPNMPALLADVERIVTTGQLEDVTSFSRSQLDDEQFKERFLRDNPDLSDALCRLEDNPILRGTLSSFGYQPGTFRRRAVAFESAFTDSARWASLTGALLATGDYQRQRPGSSAWQFGTGSAKHETVWRYLFTDAPRMALEPTRDVLAQFLDELATTDGDIDQYLERVMTRWLSSRESQAFFDWRYYLVKYPAMREGATGIYYGEQGVLGYSLCMLRTKTLNGYYRDPFLLQIWHSSGVKDAVEDPWFSGYETIPRRLRFVSSGTGMRNVAEGFMLQRPEDHRRARELEALLRDRYSVVVGEEEILVRIPQDLRDDQPIDRRDRVVLGAMLLKAMVDAGL